MAPVKTGAGTGIDYTNIIETMQEDLKFV